MSQKLDQRISITPWWQGAVTEQAPPPSSVLDQIKSEFSSKVFQERWFQTYVHPAMFDLVSDAIKLRWNPERSSASWQMTSPGQDGSEYIWLHFSTMGGSGEHFTQLVWKLLTLNSILLQQSLLNGLAPISAFLKSNKLMLQRIYCMDSSLISNCVKLYTDSRWCHQNSANITSSYMHCEHNGHRTKYR